MSLRVMLALLASLGMVVDLSCLSSLLSSAGAWSALGLLLLQEVAASYLFFVCMA
jgi:hypothetical protein